MSPHSPPHDCSFRRLHSLLFIVAQAVFILTYLQPVESAPAPSPVSRLPGSRGASSAAADTQAVEQKAFFNQNLKFQIELDQNFK